MTERIFSALNEYIKAFGDRFPTMETMGWEESKVLEVIDKCVSQGKDVYELGYLTLSEDIMY